jgi:hypothetical protein
VLFFAIKNVAVVFFLVLFKADLVNLDWIIYGASFAEPGLAFAEPGDFLCTYYCP